MDVKAELAALQQQVPKNDQGSPDKATSAAAAWVRPHGVGRVVGERSNPCFQPP